MAFEPIMNQDGTVDHDTGSIISGGTFAITSVPSTNVKTAGKGVHRGTLAGTLSGANATGFVNGTVAGNWSITGTGANTKVDGQPTVRERDVGTFNGTGTIPPPTGGTGPVAGPVVVDSAGQGEVNGD